MKTMANGNIYIKGGAKKYEELNGGEYLKLQVGDNIYAIVGSITPTKETLKWYNMLPPNTKSCFNSLMSALETYEPETPSKFIGWEPPTSCTKLGIDWTDWLNQSTISID